MSQKRKTMAEKNPRVFMDVSIDGVDSGRMIFELFKGDAPFTVQNFFALCKGQGVVGERYGLPLHYKGSFFYPILKNTSPVKCGEGHSIVKGGDFYSPLGWLGESIYKGGLPDERNHHTHNERGLLSMAIADRFSLGSHFAITLKRDHALDRFHLVFGRLIKGSQTLEKIENALVKIKFASLAKEVWVFNCGCLSDNDEGKKGSKTARALEIATLRVPQPWELRYRTHERERAKFIEEKKDCFCCTAPYR